MCIWVYVCVYEPHPYRGFVKHPNIYRKKDWNAHMYVCLKPLLYRGFAKTLPYKNLVKQHRFCRKKDRKCAYVHVHETPSLEGLHEAPRCFAKPILDTGFIHTYIHTFQSLRYWHLVALEISRETIMLYANIKIINNSNSAVTKYSRNYWSFVCKTSVMPVVKPSTNKKSQIWLMDQCQE